MYLSGQKYLSQISGYLYAYHWKLEKRMCKMRTVGNLIFICTPVYKLYYTYKCTQTHIQLVNHQKCTSTFILVFPGGSVIKNLPVNAGDMCSIPGSGRSPEGGNGHLLQYSCQENPMDRRAIWGIDHGVIKG